MNTTVIILNILGLVFNIIGTVIMAFSINSYLRTIRLALNAHEHFITSFKDPTKTTIHSAGTEIQMNKHQKRSYINLRVGIAFVLIGFLAQLVSYLILKR